MQTLWSGSQVAPDPSHHPSQLIDLPASQSTNSDTTLAIRSQPPPHSAADVSGIHVAEDESKNQDLIVIKERTHEPGKRTAYEKLCCKKHELQMEELEEKVRFEHREWESDAVLDQSDRKAFKANMTLPQEYSPAEEDHIAKGLSLLAMLDNPDVKIVPVHMKSPLLLTPSVLVKKGDHHIYGSGKITIRGATLEDVVAYMFRKFRRREPPNRKECRRLSPASFDDSH